MTVLRSLKKSLPFIPAFLLLFCQPLMAETEIGKVVKVKGKKLTIKFPKGHSVKKKDVLKIYSKDKKTGEPKKLLGTLKVRKVKKTKIYGKIKKKSKKVKKKALKRALAIKGAISGSGGGGGGGKNRIPAIAVQAGVRYLMMTRTAGEAPLAGAAPADQAGLVKANEEGATEGAGDAAVPDKYGGLNFGADAQVYPLTFIDPKSPIMGILGFGFQFYTGSYEKSAAAADPAADQQAGLVSFNETAAAGTNSNNSGESLTHMVVDVRARYADYFTKDFFSATILKFSPMDWFTTGTTDPWKYGSMSAGIEQQVILMDMIYISLGFDYLFMTTMSQPGVVAEEQPAAELISSNEGGTDAAAADAAPTAHGKGFNFTSELGVKFMFFTVNFHFQMLSREMGAPIPNNTTNEKVISDSMMNFGGKLGIVF